MSFETKTSECANVTDVGDLTKEFVIAVVLLLSAGGCLTFFQASAIFSTTHVVSALENKEGILN